MKLPKSFIWLLIIPCFVQAQSAQKLGKWPEVYVGIDSYIRRENIKLLDVGGQLTPSNWMWNYSYGFNAGYQPNKWLALESGLYRFTFARRVNFNSSFFSRSFSEPYSAMVIPIRVYINPFSFNQQKPNRWRLQLVTGMSIGSLKRYEGPPTKFSGSGVDSGVLGNGNLPNGIFHLEASQIVNGWVLNLEGGVNAQYRIGKHLTLSGTYGYTVGLNTVHQQSITYRSQTLGSVYQARQVSDGSGQTVMIGVKYRWGVE